jgi:hypothetical protein
MIDTSTPNARAAQHGSETMAPKVRIRAGDNLMANRRTNAQQLRAIDTCFRESAANPSSSQPSSRVQPHRQQSTRLCDQGRFGHDIKSFKSSSAPNSRSASPVSHTDLLRSPSRSHLLNQQILRQQSQTFGSSSSLSTVASSASPRRLHKSNSRQAIRANTATSARGSPPLSPHEEQNMQVDENRRSNATSINGTGARRGGDGESIFTTNSSASGTSDKTALHMRSEGVEENTGVPGSTSECLNIPLWTLSVRGQKFQPPRHQGTCARLLESM